MEILFLLYMSNDPDPAAGATSQWQGLKWAVATKGKSSPDWKSFLVGAEDGHVSHASVEERETSQTA